MGPGGVTTVHSYQALVLQYLETFLKTMLGCRLNVAKAHEFNLFTWFSFELTDCVCL